MTSPEQKKIGTAIYELPTEVLVSLSSVYFSAIHINIPATFGGSDTCTVKLIIFVACAGRQTALKLATGVADSAFSFGQTIRN